jgi:hypothetical protein
MPYMTDTGRQAAVFNYWYANSGVTPPAATTPFHLRLMTAMGSGNGNVSAANGTELSASGYTALGSTMGASPTFTTYSATSPAAVSNSNSVSWSATGTWSTVVGIEIWDTAATPLRYMQGTVTSNITGVVNGDTVQFASGSITANPVQW